MILFHYCKLVSCQTKNEKKNERVKATAIMISTLREHNTEKTKQYVNYILYMHNVSRGGRAAFFFCEKMRK